MKTRNILLIILLCSIAAYGQKTRPGQLPHVQAGVTCPVKVHISGVHIRPGYQKNDLYADATIEGKKIELMGPEVQYPTYQRFYVLPGDYDARLVKDSHKVAGSQLYREYELVLPDHVAWQCTVTGVFE